MIPVIGEIHISCRVHCQKPFSEPKEEQKNRKTREGSSFAAEIAEER
jgi:hypothetical protein